MFNKAVGLPHSILYSCSWTLCL